MLFPGERAALTGFGVGFGALKAPLNTKFSKVLWRPSWTVNPRSPAAFVNFANAASDTEFGMSKSLWMWTCYKLRICQRTETFPLLFQTWTDRNRVMQIHSNIIETPDYYYTFCYFSVPRTRFFGSQARLSSQLKYLNRLTYFYWNTSGSIKPRMCFQDPSTIAYQCNDQKPSLRICQSLCSEWP